MFIDWIDKQMLWRWQMKLVFVCVIKFALNFFTENLFFASFLWVTGKKNNFFLSRIVALWLLIQAFVWCLKKNRSEMRKEKMTRKNRNEIGTEQNESFRLKYEFWIKFLFFPGFINVLHQIIPSRTICSEWREFFLCLSFSSILSSKQSLLLLLRFLCVTQCKVHSTLCSFHAKIEKNKYS